MEERKDQDLRDEQDGIDGRGRGRRPAKARRLRDERKRHRNGDRQGDVRAGLVQCDVPRVLLQKEHLPGDGQAAQVEQQPLQRSEVALTLLCGAVHRGKNQKEDTQADATNAEDQQCVRRADDLHIQPVGRMPPVVEGRRCNHRNPAPSCKEHAQRRTQAEDVHRRITQRRLPVEGALIHQPQPDDRGQHAAQLDHQVGRRPEAVATDGAVPRHIPFAANVSRRHAGNARPDVPRHAA